MVFQNHLHSMKTSRTMLGFCFSQRPGLFQLLPWKFLSKSHPLFCDYFLREPSNEGENHFFSKVDSHCPSFPVSPPHGTEVSLVSQEEININQKQTNKRLISTAFLLYIALPRYVFFDTKPLKELSIPIS